MVGIDQCQMSRPESRFFHIRVRRAFRDLLAAIAVFTLPCAFFWTTAAARRCKKLWQPSVPAHRPDRLQPRAASQEFC